MFILSEEKMHFLFLLPMAVFALTSCNATNYYVSSSGSDDNDGTSMASPWRTIAKVNNQSFLPGDSILFKRGDEWHEQLNVLSSGVSGNPITFATYGTGKKPVINGADVINGWEKRYSELNANIWGVVNPYATSSRAIVVVDDSLYAEVSSITEVDSSRKYFIKRGAVDDSLFIWLPDNPNAHKVEVSKRDYCILGADARKIHHVNFTNLRAIYAGNGGLALYGTENQQFPGYCVVDSCDFYANRENSCVAYDGHSNDIFRNSTAAFNGNGFYAWMSDNLTISNCSTSHNIKYSVAPNYTDGHGYGGYKANNWIVENCYSDNDDDAIHTDAGFTPSNAVIRYNRVFNSKPGSSGIGVGNLASGGTIKIFYNLIVNASGEAVSSYNINRGSVLIYNNTIYLDNRSGTNGTIFLDQGDNFVLRNNIVMRDGGDFKTLLAVLKPSLPTSNYNQFFQVNSISSPYWFHYSELQYSSLGEWALATGQDKNSQSGDPMFSDRSSDWSLKSNSPCINKGVDVGLTRDILGNSIVGPPDLGAYEYVTSKSTSSHTTVPLSTLYPNPVHGILNNVVNCGGPGVVHCSIYDLQGRKVMYMEEAVSTGGFITARLDVSQLSNGSYLMETIIGGYTRNLSTFIKL